MNNQVIHFLFITFLLTVTQPLIAGDMSREETYKLKPTIPYMPATIDQLKDLEKIRQYYREWFAEDAALDIAASVGWYKGLGLRISGNTITGRITTPEYAGQHVLNLAKHYHHKHDTNSYIMAKNILWLLVDNGYGAEAEWKWHWEPGYRTRNYFHGLVLMLEHVPSDLRQKLVESTKYIFRSNMAWSTNWREEHILNSDQVYCNMRFQLGALAFIEDKNEAVRQLKGFKRLLDMANVPTPGTYDWVKPDGTGFHHYTHYNHYMYAYSSYSDVLHALAGTKFQISKESYDVFREMAYASIIQCHDNGQYANSLCGRYPFSQVSPMRQPQFRNLAYAGGDVYNSLADSLIAGEYNRAYNDDTVLMNRYGKAPFAEGFWQFNWSPIALYRKNNWVATAHGMNNAFFGSEIFASENRFGRYQSYGALEIIYAGGYDSSGVVENGWDWNLPPGTTTKYLPHEKLEPSGGRSDEIAASKFAGGVRFKEMKLHRMLDRGEIGMYANDFQQKSGLTPTHDGSFKFKKSFYFIDDFIVCLGSNVQCTDANNPIVTSLFQGYLYDSSKVLVVDGTEVEAFPYSNTLTSNNNWLMDAYNTGYYVVSGDALHVEKRNQISLSETGTGSNNGNYGVAWFDHGKAPTNGSYEYVVKPATTAVVMQDFATKVVSGQKPYSVWQQDANAHIVNLKNSIESYAVFKGGVDFYHGMLKNATRPCVVMMEQVDKKVNVSMSNPNMGLSFRRKTDVAPITIDLQIRGKWDIAEADEGVSVLSVLADSLTTVRIITRDGEPFDFILTEYDSTKARSLLLSKKELAIPIISDTTKLTVSVLPESAMQTEVLWSSSDTNIAIVNQDGIVKAVGTGMVKIRVTSLNESKIFDECLINSGNYIQPEEPQLQFITPLEGESFIDDRLSVKVDASDNGSISNLKLYNNGELINQKNQAPYEWTLNSMPLGKHKLQAIAEDNEGNISKDSITVNMVGVAFVDYPDTLLCDSTGIINYKVSVPITADTNLLWFSSDTNIAIISNGIIHAKNAGTALITLVADSGTYFDETIIRVVAPIIAVSGISINFTTDTIMVGERLLLKADLLPENASNKGVKWLSSDSKVLQLYNGYANAKSEGTAMITARTIDGGYEATWIIHVKEPVSSFQSNKNQDYVAIYPNPVQSNLFISLKTTEYLNSDLKIINIDGRCVYSAPIDKLELNIDVSQLIKGTYWLRLGNEYIIDPIIIIK